jgi:hypothetical protein
MVVAAGLSGSHAISARLAPLVVEAAPGVRRLPHLLRGGILHAALLDHEGQQILQSLSLGTERRPSPLHPNDERQASGSTAARGDR